MKTKASKILYWVVMTIAIYVALCYMVYRFKHPELTETQLLLSFFDVITWK